MTIRIIDDASLRDLNTFGVQAQTRRLILIEDVAELPTLIDKNLIDARSMVLGGGSNILFAGDPPSSLLRLRCNGMEIIQAQGDDVLVRAQAGMDWHAFVVWTLQQGLCGLENLALIPGTVGAAPIQNIGAYGVEVAECIVGVQAWHRKECVWHTLDNMQCAFSYRDSIFKQQSDDWIIVAVEFLLSRTLRPRLDYAGLAEELAPSNGDIRAKEIAEAVIRIRQRKLPDPAKVGNAGSFFKNPVISTVQADALQVRYAQLPTFTVSSSLRKVSAAWLIDACGWKGYREGDAGVSAQHALVLINYGEATGAQLLALAQKIAISVYERFGIAIEPEPRIVGVAWQQPV